MKIEQTLLPGVLIITPDVFDDPRGLFLESYNEKKYNEAGIHTQFVQDNYSRSIKNTLRGLHFQKKFPQGKLVSVTYGCIFDVAADINPASTTFGKYVAVELSDTHHRQMYIPAGYAHGFCVLSDVADVNYKCTHYYVRDDQHGVMWNDPALAIDWPLENPILSDQDQKWPLLKK
jgi:dTDP-4-dehydrorhamnose 3,5-epimerase